MAPKNLAILVHDDVEVLDFCGPFEAFGVTGDAGESYFNVFTVAEAAGPICPSAVAASVRSFASGRSSILASSTAAGPAAGPAVPRD